MQYMVQSEMVNGEQWREYFRTYEEAKAYATRGQMIYKLIETVE